MSLVQDATTQKVLAAYLKEPVHGLLLSGPIGAGVGSLAAQLAEKLVGHATDITTITAEQSTIPIERIRTLYEETRSIHRRSQVIIIDDADAMSREAQNALLKLLEEPVDNVYFILTTHSLESLLPTIRSRVQTLGLKPISRAQSEKLLDELQCSDTRKRSQVLFLAEGLPAELTRLAEDDEYFAEQVKYVEDARTIIQGDLYERLKVVGAYTDRLKALKLLSVVGRLISFSVLKQKQLKLLNAVATLELVGERIQANGHVRTQLTYLMTKL